MHALSMAPQGAGLAKGMAAVADRADKRLLARVLVLVVLEVIFSVKALAAQVSAWQGKLAHKGGRVIVGVDMAGEMSLVLEGLATGFTDKVVGLAPDDCFATAFA